MRSGVEGIPWKHGPPARDTSARAGVTAFGPGRWCDEHNLVGSAALGCINGHPGQPKRKSRLHATTPSGGPDERRVDIFINLLIVIYHCYHFYDIISGGARNLDSRVCVRALFASMAATKIPAPKSLPEVQECLLGYTTSAKNEVEAYSWLGLRRAPRWNGSTHPTRPLVIGSTAVSRTSHRRTAPNHLSARRQSIA